MTSCINIGAAEVKDHGPACEGSHQWTVAKLPRLPFAGLCGWAVQHGLAMKPDSGNVGKGDALVPCEVLESLGLGNGQVAFYLGKDCRLRPLEIPCAGSLQTFL